MISISLDGGKIQKSCFLAIVNVSGKHLRQIKKINTAVSTKVVPQKRSLSVKAYATMPIGIMGRKSLALND